MQQQSSLHSVWACVSKEAEWLVCWEGGRIPSGTKSLRITHSLCGRVFLSKEVFLSEVSEFVACGMEWIWDVSLRSRAKWPSHAESLSLLRFRMFIA